MNKDSESTKADEMAGALADMLATWLCKTFEIREASFYRVGQYGFDYKKTWEEAATEAGMPTHFHGLVKPLMYWSNDTESWITSILGHGYQTGAQKDE
jgi:hypothetical protein